MSGIRIGITVIIFLLLFSMRFLFSGGKKTEVISMDDEMEVSLPKKARRNPASEELKTEVKKESPLFRPEYRQALKNEKIFNDEVPREIPMPVSEEKQNFSETAVVFNAAHSAKNSRSSVQSQTVPKATHQVQQDNGFVQTFGNIEPETETKPSDNEKEQSRGKSSYDGISLHCHADHGAGAYGSPFLMVLECNAAAEIKYCIGEGQCCDPVTGSTYTDSFVIGATDGQFCLSFLGEASSGKTSSLNELFFTITSGTPQLQVVHPRVQYQTTELVGISYLTSSDFGRSHLSVGQMNLRTDPGLHDCEYLMSNYVEFPPSTPPFPFEVLADVAMDTINPGFQLEVPLRPDHLDYGDNFLMSYVIDNRESIPTYACSTQKIVLQDFEFFSHEVAHGLNGSNSVREFSGGLSSYGFFEHHDTYRGPAGLSGEEKNGQRLESGLFEIFF